MCERRREKCLGAFVYMCERARVCVCLCVTDVEQVVKWDWRGGGHRDAERCPQEGHVFSLYI